MELAGGVFEALFGHIKTLREYWNHNNIHDALVSNLIIEKNKSIKKVLAQRKLNN
jgi:hypothetical protein